MANTFLRKSSRGIGNVATAVGNYTVAANLGAVVLGLSVSNTTSTEVYANISINNGADDFYLVKYAPIPDGSTLIVVGGDQKVILQPGDSIKVESTAANSLDSMMSIMETNSIGFTADPIGGIPTITANVSSVNEGNTVAFSVSNITANAFAYANGIYYWTTNSISGTITAADFVGSANTGSFTITNGSGTISRTVLADVTTEGTEIFTISVRENSTGGNIIATSANVTIVDTSLTDPNITVNNWEIGLAGGSNYIVQITCPNNTSPPFTTLAARLAGSQMILLDDGNNGGNITVTCPNAPTTLSMLNRVTFSGVTGYAGVNRTGTQITLL